MPGQPAAAGGYIVTFWHYLEATGPPREDVTSLARLLRRLPQLPQPPLRLPPASPLSSLPEDTERCEWLIATQRSWLLARYQELQHQYAGTTWTLGCGLIHGDACTENLIHTRDQVVLSDWDSVSYGHESKTSSPPASGTGSAARKPNGTSSAPPTASTPETCPAWPSCDRCASYERSSPISAAPASRRPRPR